jgi:hypothetical protein
MVGVFREPDEFEELSLQFVHVGFKPFYFGQFVASVVVVDSEIHS